MTEEMFQELRNDAAEKYFLIPGVKSVEVRENLLRIEVTDHIAEELVPKTFLFKKMNYEIGTEIKVTG